MVRLSHAPFTPAARQPQAPMSDLDLLLPRLQKSIQELENARRKNEFEVNKLGVNIRYARSLLTSLEKEALGIQSSVRRMEIQAHLNEKRELLEGLEERHKSLQESVLHDFSDEDEDDDSSDEDLLATIIKTPSESMDSNRSANQQEDRSAMEPREEQAQEDDEPQSQARGTDQPSNSISGQEDTRTSGTMRARTQASALLTCHAEPTQELQAPQAAATSSRSYAPQPSAPSLVPPSFHPATASRDPWTSSAPETTETAEEIALRERQTQEAVSESLLQMARALKESTQGIGASLEEDKEVLEKAGEGMEKTQGGMEGAQKRLGDLKNTQHGGSAWGILGGGGLGGWMWEWKMYGIIAILWVVLLLVVFVGPKIRF